MNLVSVLFVVGPLILTFAFVLVVLRRVPVEREVMVSVRLVPFTVVVKVVRASGGAHTQ